ncbi:hypothetical protein L7H63_005263, partial [Klebsiella pneumoniae]|nr:hypothetical protein [Klebsiella pneumoniae]
TELKRSLYKCNSWKLIEISTNEKVLLTVLGLIYGVIPLSEKTIDVISKKIIKLIRTARTALSESTITIPVMFLKFTDRATNSADDKLSNIVDLVFAEFR